MSFVDSLITRSALRFAWFLSGAVVLGLSGCSDPNPLRGARFFPVKGTVLLSDGKPLTTGNVVFVGTKSQVTSSAAIASDGGFIFKSPKGDGLPEGEYRVLIEPTPGTDVKGSRGKAKINLPYASKYTDEDGSDLKATVSSDESTNSFEFTLEAKDDAKPTAAPRGGR